MIFPLYHFFKYHYHSFPDYPFIHFYPFYPLYSLKPSRIALIKVPAITAGDTATSIIVTIPQRTPHSKEDNSHSEEPQADAHPHAGLLHRALPLPDDDGADVGGQDHGHHVHGPPHRRPQVPDHDRPDPVDKKAPEPHQPHAEGDKEVEEEHLRRLLTIFCPAPI